ncbi:MAG TPA: tRNA pseudouridine(38-40) synthase TruA [archaeon]|nr:tRNA pseudouridine(38-40) synthase TruA [archaeon]
MRRIRFTIAYDGTDYCGWQYQPQKPTIQDCIEQALGEILAEKVKLIGAGRTDAGVHALGQVAHFDTSSGLSVAVVQKALNARLPRDIRVRSCGEADSSFHARYSASSKLYRYSIAESDLPEAPLLRRTHWLRSSPLDMDLLHQCAALLEGEHDFFTFSKKEREKPSHLCLVYSAQWSWNETSLHFEIAADRFLRGMVRMLVGGMVAVAGGRAEIGAFRAALSEPGRWLRAVPAPACGLCLVRVDYPDSHP